MRDPKLFSKLLEPEVGLVSSYELAAVESVPTIYNLIIDVGQRLGSDDFGVDDRVGAWDLTMAGVLRRGVGEAVERYALRPHLGSSGDLDGILSEQMTTLVAPQRCRRQPWRVQWRCRRQPCPAV